MRVWVNLRLGPKERADKKHHQQRHNDSALEGVCYVLQCSHSLLLLCKLADKGLDICIRREVDDDLATAILATLDGDILREELLEVLDQAAVRLWILLVDDWGGSLFLLVRSEA